MRTRKLEVQGHGVKDLNFSLYCLYKFEAGAVCGLIEWAIYLMRKSKGANKFKRKPIKSAVHKCRALAQKNEK